jgi:MarC family membrane protein
VDKEFFNAVILLTLITDPLGNIPLFIDAMSRVDAKRKNLVIVRECLIAFAILAVTMLSGREILNFLGLTDETLEAAGGVILLLIAINMIFPGSGAKLGGGNAEGEPLIVPIAVPLISGPSAMAAAMLVAAKDPSRMPAWLGALAICMVFSAISLKVCTLLKKMLGEQFLIAVERLMGLVLTAVSIDMLLKGVGAYLSRIL